MDFKADTALSVLARQASRDLASALVRTGTFVVLDQSEMVETFNREAVRRQINREMLLELLGQREQIDEGGLSTIGRALDAQFMVAGHIEQSRRQTRIWVRLVDVSTTSIFGYPRREFESGGSLAQEMTSIAAELVRSLPGEVHLTLVPEDARVTVDGRRAHWSPEGRLS